MNPMQPKPLATFDALLRHLRLIAALLSLALCGLPALAADYASLVSQAREQLQNDRFIEALATAKDATRTNPKDYKGHYYVALAYLGMDRFDDADAAVARALSLSPASAKPGVEKLASAIKTRRQGTGSVQAADAALADGLLGKAARLYEQAWSAGKDNPELGLKAADLYANRLGQPVDAARVLRQVQAAAKGNPAADKASTELQKLTASLREIAVTQVKAAQNAASPDAALRNLQQAEEADPSYADIFKLRAQLAAAGSSASALQSAIKDLARHQLAKISILARLPRMTEWLQQADMAEFLTDMLGAKQMETLRRAVLNPPAPDGTVFKDCADCPSMVSISGDGGLADFAIGQTEVTQGQWQAVMGRNPSYFTACGADCPVEQVSWDDAQQFIQRLNAKTGKSYRLPTEQEWEYACLAGEKTEYCGGNNVNAVAWWGAYADPVGNSGKTTNRVAGKQANAWGLYDMSGNVYEWTANCYDSGCDSRVLRGGSWYDFPQDVRSANRSNNSPGFRSRFIGFRLARTAP